MRSNESGGRRQANGRPRLAMAPDTLLILIAGVAVFFTACVTAAVLWAYGNVPADARAEPALLAEPAFAAGPAAEQASAPGSVTQAESVFAARRQAEPARRAKLTFVGDLMVHQDQLDNAYSPETGGYDFRYSLSKVRPTLTASDAAIGNLETVFAGAEAVYSEYPAFNTPDAFGEALAEAGFTLLSTANNHCMDRGEAGVLRTLDVLDGLGLAHTGTNRSPEERDDLLIQEINGIIFAFLSYTYGTNGLNPTAGTEYLVNMLDKARVAEDIARARAAGPDFVVMLPHMGVEYETAPRRDDAGWIADILAAGADVVIASHPHMAQPMEFVPVPDESGGERACFAAYSMGNFISSQRTKPRDAGFMLHLYFEKKDGEKAKITAASYTPTWMKYTGIHGGRDMIALPVPETLRAHQAGEDTGLRPQDINRIKAVRDELAEMFLGYTLPAEDMRDEVFLPGLDGGGLIME